MSCLLIIFYAESVTSYYISVYLLCDFLRGKNCILSDAAQANLESPEFVIEESSGDARFATGQ